MNKLYALFFTLLFMLTVPLAQASAPPDSNPEESPSPPIELVIELEPFHFVMGFEPALPPFTTQQYTNAAGEVQTALIQLDWGDVTLDNTKQGYFSITARTFCEDAAVSIPETVSTTCYFWDPARPHIALCQLLPRSKKIMFLNTASRAKGEVAVWWSQDDGATWVQWPQDTVKSTIAGISIPFEPIPQDTPCIFQYDEQMPDGTFARSNLFSVTLGESGSLRAAPKDGDRDGGDREPNPPLVPNPEPEPEPVPPPYIPPNTAPPPATVIPDVTPPASVDAAASDRWRWHFSVFIPLRRPPILVPAATQPPQDSTQAPPQPPIEAPSPMPTAEVTISPMPSCDPAKRPIELPAAFVSTAPTKEAIHPALSPQLRSGILKPIPGILPNKTPVSLDRAICASRGIPTGQLLLLVIAVSLVLTLPVIWHYKGPRHP